jgi:hypothetical protein
VQLQERGEVALKLGFNEKQEMEILGFYLPKGEAFAENEIQEAYLTASKNSKDLKKDKSASALFREFRERPKDKKDGKPQRCDIFT